MTFTAELMTISVMLCCLLQGAPDGTGVRQENVTLVDAGDAIGSRGRPSAHCQTAHFLWISWIRPLPICCARKSWGLTTVWTTFSAGRRRAGAHLCLLNFIDLKTRIFCFSSFKIISYGDVDVAYVGWYTELANPPLVFGIDEGELYLWLLSERWTGFMITCRIRGYCHSHGRRLCHCHPDLACGRK